MGQTLAQISSDTYIINKIAELDENIEELRANQVSTIISNGKVIIDPTGLNSVSNFPSGTAAGSTRTIINNTSYVAIPGSTLNTFTLSRTTNVLLMMNVGGFNINWPNNGTSFIQFQLWDNTNSFEFGQIPINGIVTTTSYTITTAVVSGTTVMVPPFTPHVSISDQTSSVFFISSLHAGSYSLQMRYRSSDGGNAYSDFWALGYYVLGS